MSKIIEGENKPKSSTSEYFLPREPPPPYYDPETSERQRLLPPQRVQGVPVAPPRQYQLQPEVIWEQPIIVQPRLPVPQVTFHTTYVTSQAESRAVGCGSCVASCLVCLLCCCCSPGLQCKLI